MAGFLFPVEAQGLHEQKKERRHTINERCEAAAKSSSIVRTELLGVI